MDVEHAESSAAEKTIINWGIIRAMDRALPALKVEIINRDKPINSFIVSFFEQFNFTDITQWVRA